MSGKYFDYGTGTKPKFKRKPKAPKVKKVRDRKAAARKGAQTRARKKFNKGFDYGAKTLDKPISDLAKKLAKVFRPRGF